MGYHWPPSLFAFDPTSRPFLWVQLPASSAEPILGLPPNTFPSPAMKVVVPDAYDREMVKNLPMSPAKKNLGELGLYYAMISARAADDPPLGGLPPDTVNSDGSITVNYYDFSDGSKVRRKRVTYVQGKNGQEIANRNDSEGGVPQEWNGSAWVKEGPDAEREFSKAGLAIVNAIGTIAAAVLALIPGAQIPATAFGAMWSLTMKSLANGGKPPDVGDVLSIAGSFGKAIGPGLWGIVSDSPEIQSIFNHGAIGQMAKVPGQWKDKISGLVNDIGTHLPALNMAKLWTGFDAQKWAQGELRKLPTPTNVTQGLIGVPGREVDIGNRRDASGTAFEAAARAFAEPDPDKRILLRRNYLWDYGLVSNSSAVQMGNPEGPGAHAEIEVDQGIMNAASFFDQYLASMLQSAINQAIYTSNEKIAGPVVDLGKQRKNDPQAQAALQAYVATLMDRYHMV